MNVIIQNRRGLMVLLIGLLLGPPLMAETVYKCVAGGKTSFSAKPPDGAGNCQSVDLHVPEPNPVDVTRQLEANRQYAKERDADFARRRKEPDADAQRRAQATEIAKSVAKAPVPVPKFLGSYRQIREAVRVAFWQNGLTMRRFP